jgi:hypothetical protein
MTHVNLSTRQAGLEPATYGLEGRCSIQLSYWRLSLFLLSRGARIRTEDLLLPKQARYRAAPHPEWNGKT